MKCKSKNCEAEGTEQVQYELFGHSHQEYYCKKHYRELNVLLNVFEHVEKKVLKLNIDASIFYKKLEESGFFEKEEFENLKEKELENEIL